ncbi:methylglyoxal reductase (NADPH-dependent) gre2 [Saitozyma podzolica]|uniref:Methylglyoxal reductase (NADPH-dependent) gre2 n=1 Tax=Saitozyma podzolica TaxID=1890683 RepID=A0A427XVF4_9TREE|nr:methylglyoxal reductase (NADPH-dependent) gre2 [Saitozyma podzolica]
MPAVAAGSLVLVTGASGFIAAHTVQALLDAGFPVRGSVRSVDKGEYLKERFRGKSASFDYVIVDDIEKPNAFDEAVKGVGGVVHMASPFHLKAEDPEMLIGPAVGGTVGILHSLKKHNPGVSRVVVTSSTASINDETRPAPFHFTEEHWNEYSAKVCAEKGRDAPNGHKYRASKTLAERAFWRFMETEDVAFDGVTINPPMVYGPIIHPVSNPESLNTSVATFYDWFSGRKSQADIPFIATANFVDVRDTALAHVRALVVPEASGQRFISSAGPASPNDFCIAIHHHFPQLANVADGYPTNVEEINAASYLFDGAKAARVLGITYRDIDTCVKDMGDCLLDKFSL